MTRRPAMPRPIVLAAVALACLATPALADDIFGTVQTRDGRPLSFTQIEACREGNGDACESSVTDGRGRYTIVGLSPGRYTVSVPGRRGGRSVNLRDSARADIRVD